jgi:hypothetical protein
MSESSDVSIPSLAAFAAEVIDELGGTEGALTDGLMAWSIAGQPFAALGPLGIEIRLDPAIAAAAARTPDTGPSPRGPEWVRFNPREMDGHAADRVRAWLELAHRRAAG